MVTKRTRFTGSKRPRRSLFPYSQHRTVGHSAAVNDVFGAGDGGGSAEARSRRNPLLRSVGPGVRWGFRGESPLTPCRDLVVGALAGRQLTHQPHGGFCLHPAGGTRTTRMPFGLTSLDSAQVRQRFACCGASPDFFGNEWMHGLSR